jgi:endonuclease/exonuclease/phosphatase family metal-dependent hydrolase
MDLYSTLTIGTFNLKVGVDSAPAALAADLLPLRLDLLAAQEVGEGWWMGVPIRQSQFLASAQGHSFCHFAPTLTDSLGGQFGISLSGHGEVLEVEQTLLPQIEDEQRTVLRVLLKPFESSRETLTLYTAHLSVKEREREAQARNIASMVNATSGPVIVLGDLNDTHGSPTLKALTDVGLRDPWPQHHADAPIVDGYTFSVKDPNRRIDYLLYRHLICDEVHVSRRSQSSDHFPVWGRFRLIDHP